jgi:hypothetical protein
MADTNKCSTVFLGGLGNMLFSLAQTYAYSKKYGYKPVISENHAGTLHRKPSEYFMNVFRNFEVSEDLEWHLYKEPEEVKPSMFHDIPNFGVNKLMFSGFFQSHKYFDHIKEEIQDTFGPSRKAVDYLSSKYEFKNSVSLHIRRGDYVNLSQYHHNLSIEYFINAMDYMDSTMDTVKYYVFSDDIEWCKRSLPEGNYCFVDEPEDYMQLWMMGLCTHNIIANSTFSWWGAYLNKNPNKVVIHPDKWYGELNKKYKTKDMFPDDWVCLSESYPKVAINLMGRVCSHLTKPNYRWSTVHNKISSEVKIARNDPYMGDIVIFSDDTIQTDLADKLEANHKIGWLMETREVGPGRYQAFESYKDKYSFIMTHDSELLKKYPNKTKKIPFGGCWIKDYNFGIHKKDRMLSMIYSNKTSLSGHKLRHQIAKRYTEPHFYGRGTQNPINTKEESLLNYRYSIVIENSYTENYFTEKLVDCLAVGTVPIYWGCPNIGEYFNTNGIISFRSLEELDKILNDLSDDDYLARIDAIEENLELCRQYNVIEDWIYKHILKELK